MAQPGPGRGRGRGAAGRGLPGTGQIPLPPRGRGVAPAGFHDDSGSQEPTDYALRAESDLPSSSHSSQFYFPPSQLVFGPLPFNLGTAKRDYRLEIGQLRAANFMVKHIRQGDFTIDINGCWISSTATTHYPQTRMWSNEAIRIARQSNRFVTDIGHTQLNFQISRIAYLAYHGHDIPDGLTASHLCDVMKCCNSNHIEAETQAKNIGRKGCLRICCAKHNNIILDICQHEPRCIMKHYGNLNCCTGPTSTQLSSSGSSGAPGSSVAQIASQQLAQFLVRMVDRGTSITPADRAAMADLAAVRAEDDGELVSSSFEQALAIQAADAILGNSRPNQSVLEAFLGHSSRPSSSGMEISSSQREAMLLASNVSSPRLPSPYTGAGSHLRSFSDPSNPDPSSGSGM